MLRSHGKIISQGINVTNQFRDGSSPAKCPPQLGRGLHLCPLGSPHHDLLWPIQRKTGRIIIHQKANRIQCCGGRGEEQFVVVTESATDWWPTPSSPIKIIPTAKLFIIPTPKSIKKRPPQFLTKCDLHSRAAWIDWNGSPPSWLLNSRRPCDGLEPIRYHVPGPICHVSWKHHQVGRLDLVHQKQSYKIHWKKWPLSNVWGCEIWCFWRKKWISATEQFFQSFYIMKVLFEWISLKSRLCFQTRLLLTHTTFFVCKFATA